MSDIEPFSTKVRVRYEETDRMGVVYHTNYLVYFEVGRTEFLRNYGCRYFDLEAEGFVLAVVDCAAKIHQSAEYDDEIRVEVTLGEIRKTRLTIHYRLFVGETMVVSGFTTHAVLTRDEHKPARPPAMLADALRRAGARI